MPDNWRSLALGARRIPDDPGEDPVAQALGGALGLDQEALASKMQRLSALQGRDPGTGMAPGMAPPGSERADLGLDVASAFGDLAGIIRAYHGSPHLFDKFDMSKIGTGEGAQAYGHGLYFAENPEVAKGYANKLGRGQGRVTLDGSPIDPDEINSYSITNSLYQAKGNADDAIKHLSEMKGDKYVKQEELQQDIDWIEANKNRIGYEPPEKLYTVDLDVNPEDLLDWDVPLSQQPEKVRQALEAPEIKKILETQLPFYPDAKGKIEALTGGDVQEALGKGVSTFNEISRSEAAANQLRAAGIPGLRYLDQGSRGAGEGSRNLVIFDELLAKILERNGMPIGER